MKPRRQRLSDNPDQLHAFQPRKITTGGLVLVGWADRRAMRPGYMPVSAEAAERPCRHCGCSDSHPVHLR